MRNFIVISSLAFAVIGFVPAAGRSETPPAKPIGKVDYNRDVQPILSNYCYHCHGPDTASREADLRLDLREKALTHGVADNLPVIVPGKPDQSELVKRIESHDPDEMMPQDKEKLLTKAQIALLREWIKQGAEFRDHWAFEKPAKPALPAVSVASWAKSDLDRFVLARLDEVELKPNPEADRATLVRRVSLDLTGLPPSPQELADFLADPAPTDKAYEKVVDRLLASLRFGEHRARYWLDYARYGDTQGLHNDIFRNIWPWRDYVIRSFNADKPYDQFTREQIAGDLDGNSVDAVVATGFIRTGVATGEGGTIPEELRSNLHKERSSAYSALFLGLTTQCAECHDHKYDPITASDFYALGAYFNNLAEYPSTKDNPNWPPNYAVPTEANRAKADALWAERANAKAALDKRMQEGLNAWIAAGADLPKAISDAGLETWLPLNEGKGELVRNRAPGHAEEYRIAGPAAAWREITHLWESFRLAPNTILALPEAGKLETAQSFSAGCWILPRKQGSILSRMDDRPSAKFKGWDFQLSGGKPVVVLSAAFPDSAIEVASADLAAPDNRWSHVLFTYDGSGAAAGVKIYVNGKPAKLQTKRDTLKGSMSTDVPMHLGRRLVSNQSQECAFQDVRVYRRALTAEEAARLPFEDAAARILAAKPAQFSVDQRWILEKVFAERDAKVKELTAQLASVDARLAAASAGGHVTLVCKEADTLPYAAKEKRGSFSSRLERLAPATPHFLPGRREGGDRRQLAEWTVKDNPIFARVAVNRAWQEIFGIGIVESADDFGIVGDRPSNQALLDFLAADFADHGWKVKRLYRQMVLSATYRQDAKAAPAAFARDPKNQLLARGPRFRMDSEMIRDAALAASGLLVEKLGGPSVKPYQPSGVWEAGGQSPKVANTTSVYKQDHGDALYRRSLYTFWKRQAIMPDQEVMDAPDRQLSCIRRPRTNTPLGALALFNNVQLLEAARLLGLRAIREGGADDTKRLDFIARCTMARSLAPVEIPILAKSLEAFRAYYGAKPEEAAALLTQGEKPKAADLADAEQAAWMMTAHQFLNLDEAINK